MDTTFFRPEWGWVIVIIAVIGVIWYLSQSESYIVLETPAGGIIDPEDAPLPPGSPSTDPLDTGIEDEMWGPLYPLPERPPYAKLSGLPYNYPPLQNDPFLPHGDLAKIAQQTTFSNR